MPAVIDTPAIVEHEAYALYGEHDRDNPHEEQPQARAAHAGFWQTVKQYVTRHRVQTPTGTPSLSHISRHPLEMPLERLAREHPTLFLRVFTGL
jgi:hypothetical protein